MERIGRKIAQMDYQKNFTLNGKKRVYKYLNLILLLFLCAVSLFFFLRDRNIIGLHNQWDFRTYYVSTKTFESGLDPYNNKDVNYINNTPYIIPSAQTYPYHPFTFPYFQIFTRFSYPQALKIYMLYNLLLIFLLIYLWKIFLFPEKLNVLIFLMILLFSFNSAIFRGLTAGNPAFFESTIIWLALIALMKEQRFIFLILISIISFFKGTPLILTFMFFFLPAKQKNIQIFLLFLTTFITIWLSPLWFAPQMFRNFWAYASNVREIGIINPCFYALAQDLLQIIAINTRWIINGVYGIWILGIFSIYIFLIRGLNWKENKLMIVLFTLLTYALIVPRFKDYAYIQLLPVAYFLTIKHPGLLFLYLFEVLSEGIKLPSLIREYNPFFSAVVSWIIFASYLSKNMRRTICVSPRVNHNIESTI